jgi:dTDP-4-dehydrorhamnose reductase
MISSELIKTRILIIGSNGMLGQSITEMFASSDRFELLCTSIEKEPVNDKVNYRSLDIMQKHKVKEIILNFFPDYIINTAAYTNVDLAETEKELAWKTNVSGVENISLYSWTVDAHLIHVSTDYIFDGKNGPYSEEDKPYPINYYGRTKLASENLIRTSGVRFTILRSNVLYGATKFGRPDFVKWVVDSLKSKRIIKIVQDQFNNPTFINDLSQAISKIIEFKKEGIFNIAGAEILSRYEFALRIADYFRLDKSLIVPIKTEELNQPASRPMNSGLITLKAATEIGYYPTPIENSFEKIQSIL